MPGRPSYTAGKFAIEVDGSAAGFVISAEGGEPFAPVVAEPPVGILVRKHLLSPQYAPIVVDAGASMAPPFLDWVAAMLDGTQTAMDGAIVFLDYAMKEESRLEWTAALITEVAFPAADASSKDWARIRVTMQPDSTVVVAGSRAVLSDATGSEGGEGIALVKLPVHNLGLAIGPNTVRVAPVVVGGSIVADDDPRVHEVTPGPLDVSDLVFWLPESALASVAPWFEDFVMKGNNESTKERTASLAYLDPSLKDELLRLEFDGVGIHRISPERQEDSAGVVALVKIETYCESVALAKPPAVAPPQEAEPRTATAETLADAIATALRPRLAAAVLTPDAITERLLASSERAPAVDDRQRAHAAGRAWASEHARLDELEAIAALAERDGWTAIALPEGNSLVAFLAASGDLDAEETGPIDLKRDEFTTGLVAGATDVYREVEPHLHERLPPGP